MNINEMTIGELKDLQNLMGGNKPSSKGNPFKIGENYLVRTVTHIQLGKLISVFEDEIVMTHCSWVADTGRFQECFANGITASSSSEVEPFPLSAEVIIGRGAIIDACIYTHDLPDSVK